MIKSILTLIIILSLSIDGNTQNLASNKHTSQSNDSLQKAIAKPFLDSISKLHNIITTLLTSSNDNVSKLKEMKAIEEENKNLNQELIIREKKINKLSNRNLNIKNEDLNHKLDSLYKINKKLNTSLEIKSFQIDTLKKTNDTNLKSEKESIKSKIINSLDVFYKNKTFDDLLHSSTKQSIQRDKQILSDDKELQSTISDMEIYFNAQQLLYEKFDSNKCKIVLLQLKNIKRSSEKLKELIGIIEMYEDYNDELIVMLEKFIKMRSGGYPDIKSKNLNIIKDGVIKYEYDFYDFYKYPYLNEVIIQTIKRKIQDPDAEIIDLLKRLR